MYYAFSNGDNDALLSLVIFDIKTGEIAVVDNITVITNRNSSFIVVWNVFYVQGRLVGLANIIDGMTQSVNH